MKILNFGCGGKVSKHDDIINIDWSIALRLKRSVFGRVCARLYLKGVRLDEFSQLSSNILVHDLSRGIPFPDGSIDAVYHCHMLEHLDRNVVPVFLAEVKRVLRKGGLHRIVVPDFHSLNEGYLRSYNECALTGSAVEHHDVYIAKIIEQSVRRESWGTSGQKPFRRFIENLIFGDARKRGETHQWMYDRFNLTWLLENAGFETVLIQDFNRSEISGWSEYGLDADDDTGDAYKPDSLYIEAIK